MHIMLYVQNGMAYEADGGIYFDVERMGTEYGKLGVGHQAEGVEEADLRGKRSHKDFALWKRAKPGEPWRVYNGLVLKANEATNTNAGNCSCVYLVV